MCWLGPGAEPGGGGPESPDGPDDGVFAVASPAPPHEGLLPASCMSRVELRDDVPYACPCPCNDGGVPSDASVIGPSGVTAAEALVALGPPMRRAFFCVAAGEASLTRR